MESYIGTAAPQLISQLDYSLKSSAPYVLQRRSVRFYPNSATSFTPGGTNVCRITLASEGEWLDPSTVRFCGRLHNLSNANAIAPFSTIASSLFQRVREMIGGTVTSDVLYYNRTAETFHNLLEPVEWQFSEAILGFGGSIASGIVGGLGNYSYPGDRHPTGGEIRVGRSYTCLQRLMTALIRSNKLLPLRVAPVTYELTLANPQDFCVDGRNANYALENCYILADVLTLDSTIQNNYMNGLLRGGSLAISVPQYITLFFPIAPGTQATSIVVQRALTRNVSVFVSFKTATDNVSHFPNPNFPTISSFQWDDTAYPNLQDGEFGFQLQLGSKLWPESPMTSFAEMYETLRKTLGVHSQDLRNCSLDRRDYYGNGFVLGVDLERCLGDPFSSVNTRSGDVLRLNFTGINPATEIQGCYVTLFGSAIVELREQGAFLFD